jgi:hypothetical protein
MKLFASWIVSTLLAIFLPIYVAFIYDLLKKKEWKRFGWNLFAAILIISAIFSLGWYGIVVASAASSKRKPDLVYFDKAELLAEISLQPHEIVAADSNASIKMQINLNKFDEADYLLRKKDRDFDQVIGLYKEIIGGFDANGSAEPSKTACVFNNLALVYFQKQEDQGFQASSLLFQARQTAPKSQHAGEIIQHNIDELDKYVNDKR